MHRWRPARRTANICRRFWSYHHCGKGSTTSSRASSAVYSTVRHMSRPACGPARPLNRLVQRWTCVRRWGCRFLTDSWSYALTIRTRSGPDKGDRESWSESGQSPRLSTKNHPTWSKLRLRWTICWTCGCKRCRRAPIAREYALLLHHVPIRAGSHREGANRKAVAVTVRA